MNTQSSDKLEQSLAMLSSASDEPVQLWKAALAEHDELKQNHSQKPTINQAARALWLLTRIGVAATFLVVVGAYLGSFTSARNRAKVHSVANGLASAQHTYSLESTEWPKPTSSAAAQIGYIGDSAEPPADQASEGRFDRATAGAFGRGGRGTVSRDRTASDAPPPFAARHVIRKASLELRSPDVRAVFAKIPLVLNEGLGEFVQDSSLTGTVERPEASLTLLVAADRLSAVLNELRELGTVASERVAGEDVSGTVVDLEARLQNERRIEKELLELLDKRPDAPLKELLEVRNELSRVRLVIEQLAGQREHLGRLVSLATVLVIVRVPDAVDTPIAEPTMLDYVANAFNNATRTGTRTLIYTIAEIVQLLIGGAIWWAILLATVIYVRRRFTRS